MATLSCGNVTSISNRTFSWLQKDPNNYLFCNKDTTVPTGCLDPFRTSGQQAIPGDNIFPDNMKVTINNESLPLTCNNLVKWKLNENYDANFKNTLINLGCSIQSNTTNNRIETGCVFGNQAPKFVNTCDPYPDIPFVTFQRNNCDFTWTCPMVSPDPVYKPLCCNATNKEFLGSETDPYTGQPFNQNACAPNWCLADPAGECLDLFLQSCTDTVSCHRQSFLTFRSPVSSTNALLNSISIEGTYGRGFQCADYYEETKRQAALRAYFTSTSYETVVNDRVLDTMNLVKSFCAQPETLGNGECACLNAIQGMGAEFAERLTANALSFQVNANTKIPMMLVQDASGSYRRADAFCAPTSGPITNSWTEALTYTLGTQTYTISNVCSNSSPFWPYNATSSNEYTVPSMNPNRSLDSLSNFGDVVYNYLNLESARNLGDNTFGIPLHCWLPSCVGRAGNALDNDLVFLDLTQFTKTCPNICYMYSAANSVDIGNTIGDQTFIHIDNNFQVCDFINNNKQYTYQPFPFALPSSCQQLYIQAPINYSGLIHITVTNPEVDISSLFPIKSLSGYSNLAPLVSFINGTASQSTFSTVPIYKYSYSTYPSSVPGPDFAVLSLSLNTNGMSPWTSFQSEINLFDNNQNFQQIVLQIYVYPDGQGSGGTQTIEPLACGEVTFNTTTGKIDCVAPCDCSFGSNTNYCNDSTFKLVSNDIALTTGFTSDGDPILQYRPLQPSTIVGTGSTYLSTFDLQRTSAAHQLLSAIQNSNA
jgi:hypothetical protein